MKILYSCPLDPVKLSAPGQHVASVVKELKKLGNKTVLVHQGSTLPGVVPADQIPLNLDRNRLLKRLDSDVRYAIALFKILKGSEIQCVYHRMEKWSVLPLLVFKWFKLYTVIEFNADNRSELVSMNASRVARYLYPLSEYLQVRFADRVVVVSEGIGKSLSRNFYRFKHKIDVVENGADTDNYFPRDRTASCASLDLNENMRYVVFTGSFQKWQGLETLVESAVIVTQKLNDIRFILVGDGKVQNDLYQLIDRNGLKEYFILPGWQTPQCVAQYLSVADVCVAPYSPLAALEGESRSLTYSKILMKCSPLKIYTYMAMGRPIVASGFLDGGIRLEEWGVGLAFEPGNTQALADTILQLLQDKKLACQLGNKAYERAKTHHTWAAVGKKIENILSQRNIS